MDYKIIERNEERNEIILKIIFISWYNKYKLNSSFKSILPPSIV